MCGGGGRRSWAPDRHARDTTGARRGMVPVVAISDAFIPCCGPCCVRNYMHKMRVAFHFLHITWAYINPLHGFHDANMKG